MNRYLQYLETLERDNIYVAIGSAPHCDIESYDDQRNQLFPPFVREMGGTWTLIHVDPEFKNVKQQEFIDTYFKRMGFVEESPTMYIHPYIDALFIPTHMENTERLEFLTQITKRTILRKKKLFVQQYTGHELYPEFEELLKTLTNDQRQYVKQNIIWDVTYGKDCSCMTDMTLCRPLYLGSELFNLACMTEQELLNCVGKHSDIDNLLSHILEKRYKYYIAIHQVNYRRRIKGMDLYHPTLKYSHDVDPDTVMQILSDYLNPILPVLKKLRKIPQEVYDKQLDMLNNYHLHDVYQWYSIMNGIYN